MNNSTNDTPDSAPSEPAPHRWLPIEALQPGMVLAKPVHVAQHGVLIMKLGEGVELQANTIDQLFSKGVECVPVRDDSTPDNAHLAALKKAYRERLLVIFASETEEEVQPNCRKLFSALLIAGPQI
jgi:hypothetical protein